MYGNAAENDPTEGLLRGLVDATPVPLWRSGPDGNCTYVNLAWREFTGSALDDALNEGWQAGVHPDDIGAMRDAAVAACGRREPIDLEYRLRRHDGSWRWLNDRRRPLWRNGDFVGIIGCGLDLTDLRDKDAECRQAVAERDVLLAELQHRVRNNAQATTSLLALQANRAGDPRVVRALRAAARRATVVTVVQEAMGFGTGPAAVELGAALELAAHAVVAAAAAPAITLVVERRAACRIAVARAQPLTLATAELVANAAHHAYPDGTGSILLSLTQPNPGELAILVADTGTGLRRRRRRGLTPTGELGLHLAERLCAQAGAALELETGAGTRARLRLTI